MPDPKSSAVYTTTEVDAMFATRDAELASLDGRVSELEDGDPNPPDPEPPTEGTNLVLTFTPPADLVAGRSTVLSAAITNDGTVAIAPGVILGVGFYLDDAEAGDSVAWASTQAGLHAGASVVLDTSSAPMHSGPWVPAEGDFVLSAFVDDVNRVPEYDEQDNVVSVPVTVAPSSSGGGGNGGTVLRPFADNSLWNTPKNPQVFAAGADDKLRSSSWGLNNGDYSHPVTWSTNDDPEHYIQTPDTWGWPAGTLVVHMRDDAVPAAGTDGHLSLLNIDNPDNLGGVDLWQLHSTGARHWSCSAYARFDVWGSGWGQASPFKSAGVTAAGAPTVAGTITAAALDAGVIDFALCCAWSYNDQGGVNTSWSPQVAPAISNDVGGGGGPICEGALLVVGGNAPAGLNADELLVFNAAKKYGVYVVDKLDGQPNLYGDRSARVGNALRGDKLTAIMRQARMVQTW